MRLDIVFPMILLLVVVVYNQIAAPGAHPPALKNLLMPRSWMLLCFPLVLESPLDRLEYASHLEK